MRILVVAEPTCWAGTEVNTCLMIEALGERSHTVDVLEMTRTEHGHYAVNWANPFGRVISQPPPLGRGLKSAPWWWRQLSTLAPDAVVLAKGYVNTAYPGLDLVAFLRGTPVVLVEHHPALDTAVMPHWHPWTWLGGWFNRTYVAVHLQHLLAHTAVFVSEVCKRGLETYLHRRLGHRSHVVHPGVPLQRVMRDPLGAERVRASYGIPPEALVFGALGRLVPNKGFDRALVAFSEANIPNTSHFLLAGTGPEELALSALARHLGVHDRVHLAGMIRDEERSAYLTAMDCFVMLSTLEGLGMALIEALACGTYSIATRCGGPQEVLTSDDLGRLIPTGNSCAARAAMERVAELWCEGRLKDPVQVRTAHVEAMFDSKTQNATYATIIECSATRLPPGNNWQLGGR